jgi:AcrR family transcriptional regulator
MGEGPTACDGSALGNLQVTLEAALSLLRELADDDLLRRMIAAFHAMPEDDRPVVVDVLEHEVKGRLLSRSTEDSIGQSTRPNPNARLYIRSFESGFDRRALEHDDMLIANVRTMQASAVIRSIPEMYAIWKDAMRAAMDEVDDATRVTFAEMLDHILRCIDEKQASEPDAHVPGPHKRSRSRRLPTP